jgi:hypothetical protein
MIVLEAPCQGEANHNKSNACNKKAGLFPSPACDFY